LTVVTADDDTTLVETTDDARPNGTDAELLVFSDEDGDADNEIVGITEATASLTADVALDIPIEVIDQAPPAMGSTVKSSSLAVPSTDGPTAYR
jgi:hypothetical protein